MAGVLIVDGYNIIHCWSSLSSIMRNTGLEAARDKLISEMEDYAGSSHTRIIVVFDAYHTDRLLLTRQYRNGVEVVFTRQKETADHYIERLVDSLDPLRDDVKVATSDGVEQVVVMGRGAARISARELEIDVKSAKADRNIHMEIAAKKAKQTLETLIDPETLKAWRNALEKEED